MSAIIETHSDGFMIEIYLLEALAAFYQYGTLSAASEHLHISQPALSRSMQKLEDLMGVSLFERTKNRITLNETGKLAAMHAERILQLEEEMIRIVRNYDSSLHTISVGYCAPGPMMEMPAMLSSLYPGMAVPSEIEEEEKLLKGVRSRKYTMAVLSYPVQDENLVCRKCGSEQLFISLIPAHPAAMFRDTGVSFADMNGETFVIADQVGVWERITRKNMPDSKLLKQSSLDSLNEIVNSSSLPAFATDLTLRVFRRESNPNRIFVPLTDPDAKLTYYAVCLKENEKKLRAWFQRNAESE